MQVIPVISKLIFSIITPVTWSFRNHSNILICCSKNTYYYVENSWVEFFFRFLWWIERSEEQHLSGIEIFCNITNIFIITFDQFKASLLNKSINFYNFSPPTKKEKKNNYTDSKWVAAENKKIEQQEEHVAGDGPIIENVIWFYASRRRCEREN